MKHSTRYIITLIFFVALALLVVSGYYGYQGVIELNKFDVSTLDKTTWPNNVGTAIAFIAKNNNLLISFVTALASLIIFAIISRKGIKTITILSSVLIVFSLIIILAFMISCIALYLEPNLLWRFVKIKI